MARLQIRVLGSFEVVLDGEPVTEFESDTARAFLAYLAAEPGRRWSRAVIAEMLWPERPEGAALSNLRHVLTVVRRALHQEKSETLWLATDRASVSLVLSPDIAVDLLDLERLAGASAGQRGAANKWQQAVSLWRGPFLDGMHVRAGAEWEEWLVVAAERARRSYVTALSLIADHHERAGEWDRALSSAQRLVDTDPWEEQAHRQVMRLLARSGETTRALEHYSRLSHMLNSEFGSAPAAESSALADQIRTGGLAIPTRDLEIVYPQFLGDDPQATPTSTLFVGRDDELAALRGPLDSAVSGDGRVLLIGGEAGSGKTMLAGEFAKRATALSEVLVARGRCNAYGGLGDPYLPFREVLARLTGDVESSLSAGAVDREQATRLWEAIPIASRLIHERGPSLIGTMVNGAGLFERTTEAMPGAAWLEALRDQVAAAAQRPVLPERMQPALFDEYTAVLEGIAAVRPIVVVVDDLQWADGGSIALLWHLARRIEGMPLLLVGLFRPEEIEGRASSPHPLEKVLHELRAAKPDCMIEMSTDRGFVDAFLDAEPNALNETFRSHLFTATAGHPLFTVEMVRGMQDRAEIRRNQDGLWTAEDSINWRELPTRVEAVIGQRIARLPAEVRYDLDAAAIQGEEFVAEVVAAVRSDRDAPGRLSQESVSALRLVEPAGVTRIDGEQVSRHRFRHALFQSYLHERIEPAERVRLHEATGRALEELYKDQADPPVVDLAHHFDSAGLTAPAIDYLQKAGERAIAMSANEEALRLLQRALELLPDLPRSSERDNTELALLVGLAASVMAVRGYAAPEAQQIGVRMRQLCDEVQPSPMVVMALVGLAQVLSIRAQHGAAAEASSEALGVAESLGNDAFRVLASFEFGYCLFWQGELEEAQRYLDEACRIYEPLAHGWLARAFGIDPGAEALIWAAACQLLSGYADKSAALGAEAIAAARRLEHPFTLCHVLAVQAVDKLTIGEYEEALVLARELEAVATSEHFPYWEAGADVYGGWALGLLGEPEEGVHLMGRGLDAWRGLGAQCHLGFFSCPLAELEIMSGRPERGLEIVARAISEIEATDEGLSKTYLGAEHGRLLRIVEDPSAEAALRKAVADADKMGARIAELQARTELARLLEAADRAAEGIGMLETAVFTLADGIATPALVAAQEVLDRPRA